MTNEQIQALQAAAEKLKEIGIIHNYSKSVAAQIAFEKAATPEVILSLLAEREADKALIAVYSDAYKEAAHEASVNWEAATALAEENAELKQRIAELEEREKRIIKLANDSGELCDRVMDALESRTLTVKFPEPLMPAQHNSGELFMTPDNVEQGGYLNCDDVLRALRKACVAAGIKLDVGGDN